VAAPSAKRGHPIRTTRERHYNLNSRLRTKGSSRRFGLRPKPIDAYSATGPKMSVLKIRTNTALKKTPRSRLLASLTSDIRTAVIYQKSGFAASGRCTSPWLKKSLLFSLHATGTSGAFSTWRPLDRRPRHGERAGVLDED
jgi:hypothetical protein